VPWMYQRRRKSDRPLCELCGLPYFAGSTRGATTYYYTHPRCRCLAGNRKAIRKLIWSAAPREKRAA
jgi:hypothetical protein